MPRILSFDEGTTSARTALYDERGSRLAMKSEPIPCEFPHPGWVQQDAEAIWRAQLLSAKAVLADSPGAIAALGITNQRETTIVWDRSGRAVAPAIVWQCRRTAEFCAALSQSPEAAAITSKTGLVVDAYFSGSKIRWILENVPDARAKAQNGELLFGNVDTWLIWKLTNGAVHVTDVSNASRTMLMNLREGTWDDQLLQIFGIPRTMLPDIVHSSEIVGHTAPEHLGAEIPIAGIAGDQQAALAGQACFRPGLSKNTYGTGCFALLHTGGTPPAASKHKLLATRAASTGAKPQFAVEGSVFVAGASIQWLRDKLGLLAASAQSEQAALSVADTGGVYFVPAFVGLGAPHWDAEARGTICGMTFGTTRAHIIRSALEAIAFQTRELTDAMQADGDANITELRVDGGASANNFLMQFQADILGYPIVRPADVETTALGAAYLAGLSTGIWKDCAELESFWRRERVFEPQMDRSRADELFASWKDAVRRSRGTLS